MTFNPGANSIVYVSRLTIGWQDRGRRHIQPIGREYAQSHWPLDSSGALDTSFDPGVGPNNDVYTLAVQADGKIILGGGFITLGRAVREPISDG